MPFRRPVGATIDVKELEYISALHQTCLPVCRENGTVSSVDILRFLRSRFGLKISHSEALEVVRGLGGGAISEEAIERIAQDVDVGSDEEDAPEEKKSKRLGRLGAGMGALKKRLIKSESERVVKELKKVIEEEEGQGEKFDDEFVQQDQEDVEDIGADDQEEYLDLVQLLSVLLIPTIARAGKEFRDGEQPAASAEGVGPLVVWYNPISWYKKYAFNVKAKNQKLANELHESLRPKPEGLLEDVLKMLVGTLNHDNDTDPSSRASSMSDPDSFRSSIKEETDGHPTLNAQLVETLLVAWGEHERAKDTKLIDAMVDAAGGPGSALNAKAFVKALTTDLELWEVGAEDRMSTAAYDVFQYESRAEKRAVEAEQEALKKQEIEKKVSTSEEGSAESGEAEEKQEEEQFEVRLPPTGANIDFAVDVHGSIWATAIMWFFFVCTALVYAVLFQDIEGLQANCEPSFGCTLAGTILTWLFLAVVLSVTGILVIVPLSLANSPITTTPLIVVFCLLLGAAYTFLPYMIVGKVRDDAEEPFTDVEKLINEADFERTQNITFAAGIILLATLVVQLIVALIGRPNVRSSSGYVKKLATSSHVKGCHRIKKAATRKINVMLQNAHALHPEGHSNENGGENPSKRNSMLSSLRGNSTTDETMLNFVLRGERYEQCGGLFWTWKKIFTKELFDTEGIWINSRIIVFQTAQVVLGVVIMYAAFIATELIADEADQATEDLKDYEDLPQWIHDIVPTREQVYAAFYPANGVAIVVMVSIILIYVPSAVATTLQYRTGVYPALTSKMFNTYRGNADTVYLNIGNAIYAMAGSAALFWLLTALMIFLFVWDFTRDIMILLTAWGIGLTVTIVLKMVMTMFCRKRFYAAYYRTHPLRANLSLLALECWFIGLGGGILLGRFTQFLLAAAFWVGRIDAPFLDKNVNLVGYGFDYVPFNFVKDLLGHEAHRHPYLDRLGCMYMMKLKHGKKFGTAAGSVWRQLFVVSLMPWMMKNRVFDDAKLTLAIEAFKKKRAQEKRKSVVGGALDFGDELVTGLKTGGMGVPPDEEVEALSDS